MADDHVSRLDGERLELIKAVRNVYDAAVDGSPIKQFDAGGQLQ